MPRVYLGFVFCVALSLVASAFGKEPDYVEGQLILRFASPTTLDEARQSLDSKNYEVVRALVPELNIFLVKLKHGLKVKETMRQMMALDDVAYAQADHKVTLRDTSPNDAEFAKQWALVNPAHNGADIKATQAWDFGAGGKDRDGNDIVIAIVDGGMDVAHSDLKGNLWVNKGEIPANQIDDDKNGYIDDINGWNASEKNGAIPIATHGTHVAGIAGASGNNGTLITGVNWNVKLMAVATPSGTTSSVVEAYGYVLKQKRLWLDSHGKQGANVVVTNSSFGIDYADCTKGSYPLWNDLYNEMGKVGILSAVATANLNIDVDVKGDVPSGCSSEYLVKVTNTDSNDKINEGAAYGKSTVDLGAPGTEILSTIPGNRVGSLTGTSMATPHVAGAVAFLHSVGSEDFQKAVKKDPGAGALLLKMLLLVNVDPLTELENMTTSGGRLNLYTSAKAVAGYKAE